MPPMPPFEYPKVCLTPLISWRSMWPSISAVPGVRGPAGKPIVVAVASIAFTTSDCKDWSRRSAAVCRRMRRASSSASGPLNSPSRSGNGGGGSRTVASMSSMTSVQKATYFGYAAASFRENRASSFSFRFASFQRRRESPFGKGKKNCGSNGWASYPNRASSRSRMISGRKRPAEYASRENLTPGKTSSVMQAPPRIGRRSTTRTRRPARARYAAATRRLWPPPTTMASHVPATGRGARDSYVSLVGHGVIRLLRQAISGRLHSALRGRERGRPPERLGRHPRKARERRGPRRRGLPARARETRVRAAGSLHAGGRPRASGGRPGAPSGIPRCRRGGPAVPRVLREQGEARDGRVCEQGARHQPRRGTARARSRPRQGPGRGKPPPHLAVRPEGQAGGGQRSPAFLPAAPSPNSGKGRPRKRRDVLLARGGHPCRRANPADGHAIDGDRFVRQGAAVI